MLRNHLEKLLARQNLTEHEIETAVEAMISGQDPHQVAALLVLMRSKGETPYEISALVRAMRKYAIPVTLDRPVLDIVGTGGDGANTVNISTGAAIVAAACGASVAKHGNRAVSSRCGSADVLEALGVDTEATADGVAQSIKTHGIAFMLAPLFNPALKQISGVRRALKVPTIFNLIGPLMNPARAEYMVFGVFRKDLVEVMAQTLQKLGIVRALVFYGNGTDELTPTGPVEAIEVTQDALKYLTIEPEKYGLLRCHLVDLKGGQARENAQLLRETFQGKPGPISDTLALNAGVGLWILGLVKNITDGVVYSKETLNNGSADRLLQKWIGKDA
jgi:anthranilate phosphoribosyltransferase